MGKYTVNSNDKIDKQLDSYFGLITNEVINLIGKKNIVAIVLFGSFGRGEGGVVIKNNKVTPVNDFDISIYIRGNIIKTRSLFSKKLETKAQELSKKIGIKQIDLDLSHPFSLLFASVGNYNYERLNGYKVLYGKINIKKWMLLKTDPTDIPLIDGSNYFLNRGSGLILAYYSLKYFQGNNKVVNQNFFIEINKAILAVGDSFLILIKKYNYSYSERIKITNELNKDIFPIPSMKRLYIEALKWKLKPHFDSHTISKKQKEIKINSTINFFSDFFLWFESERHNIKFKDWIDYSSKITNVEKVKPLELSKKIVLILLKNPTSLFQFQNIKKIFKNYFSVKLSLMSQILFSAINENKNTNQLKLNAKSSLKTHYSIDTNLDWKNLAKEYLNIYHPKGLLGFIIEKDKKL